MKRCILPVIILCIAYTGLWYFLASRIETQARIFLASPEQNEFIVRGSVSGVTGFPLTPQILFSGSLEKDGISIAIPILLAKSFFLPGTGIFLSLPQGLAIAPEQGVDFLEIRARIPSHLPGDFTQQSISQWKQTSGAAISIKNFTVKKQSLTITGSGDVMLDDLLRPSGTLPVSIQGYGDFISWLQERKMVEPRQAMLALAVMNGLSRIDTETQARTVSTTLMLQNCLLFAGPIRITELPENICSKPLHRLPPSSPAQTIPPPGEGG